MGTLRRLRFITRRRLKWVAVIAAGLCAVLCVATLWISPRFIAIDQHYALWLLADRGRVDAGVLMDESRIVDERRTAASIEKLTPTGFDLWFLIERTPFKNGNASSARYKLAVPLWFPFIACAALAVYLRRTDRPKPWQCAACRYDLRGIDTDTCPECGKQSERTS